METFLLEDDNPANALLSFISESGVQTLVLGSDSGNFITKYVFLNIQCIKANIFCFSILLWLDPA